MIPMKNEILMLLNYYFNISIVYFYMRVRDYSYYTTTDGNFLWADEKNLI